MLRAGALPAPLVVLEERSVGPGLGSDSIEAGKLATMIGLVAVVAFIIASYGSFGVIATVALMINIVLLVAALSLLNATLTLPGIAGIVLTMGMAVDANVLIFERIREELSRGRTIVSAVTDGFRQATSTIVDANLTTLFAALCLYFLGSGPIQGFLCYPWYRCDYINVQRCSCDPHVCGLLAELAASGQTGSLRGDDDAIAQDRAAKYIAALPAFPHGGAGILGCPRAGFDCRMGRYRPQYGDRFPWRFLG